MFLLPADYYQVKKVSKKGRGVFARKDIPAGMVIGDYIGMIVKDEKLEALEKKYGNSCYAMDYDDDRGLSVFPLDIKAVGIHLINHSCNPNCDAYYYYGHTLYFALRRIIAGEELTVDYGFDAGDVNESRLIYPCFCGSPSCRGTMYASSERLLKYSLYYYQETKGQKNKPLPAGKVLPLLDKYPIEIKDNAIFNLYADKEAAAISYDDEKIPAMKEIRKRLRESGRILNLKNLGLKIIAVVNGNIVAEK